MPDNFLDLAAITTGEDLLFKESTQFLALLKRTGEHLAKATADSPTVVVALMGDWGGGKTSALNLLIESWSKEANPNIGRFLLPHIATGAGSIDAAIDLAVFRSLLLSIDAETLQKIATMLEVPAKIAKFDDAGLDHLARLNLLETLLEQLGSKSGRSEFLLFEAIRRQAGITSATVVIFDDLDRCDPEKTQGLLLALNAWGSVPGLVFVIASSREYLDKALGPLGGDAELDERTFSKYVHLTVEVPRLLDRVETVRSFLGRLLDMVEFESPAAREYLASELLSSVGGEDGGSLSPVLRVCIGATPRKVKTQVNLLTAELAGLQSVDALSVRLAVCRVLWPETFSLLVGPAISGDELALQRFRSLINAGVRARRSLPDGIDIALAVFDRWENEMLSDERVSREAVIYLAALDWSRLDPDPSGGPSNRRDATSDEAAHEIANLPREWDRVRDTYQQMQLANLRNDSEATIALARDLLEQIGDDELPKDLAPMVGNAAIHASSAGDLETASALHRLAVAAAPDHSNILQNLAAFLIEDRAGPGDLDEAGRLVEQLDHPPHAEWRRGRSLALRLELALKTGAERSIVQDLARQMVVAASQPGGSITDALGAVDALGKSVHWREGVEIVQALGALGAPEERFVLLRQLADSLAVTGRGKDELNALAADLYELGLSADARLGFIESGERRGDSRVLHNMASVTRDMDYPELAGLLWFLAYQLDSQDLAIRRSFSNWVIGHRRDAALAEAITNGQRVQIDDLHLDVEEEGAPLQFSAGDAWWREVPINGAWGDGADLYPELARVRHWLDGAQAHSVGQPGAPSDDPPDDPPEGAVVPV